MIFVGFTALSVEIITNRFTPFSPAALAALRQIVYGDPKKIFSFRLDGESLKQLGKISEHYMLLQLDRGFGTLDFYRQLSI